MTLSSRGNPMTRDEANQQRANPNLGKSKGYEDNCQSCVVAYEARLRGYDVQTKSFENNQKTDYLSRYSDESWIDPITGKPLAGIRNDASTVKNPKQVKVWLENTVQPGERYTFGHAWKGCRGAGPIISVDRDTDGKLRLYDPQDGKTYKGYALNGYLNNSKAVRTVHGYTFGTMKLTRVDNMRINPAYADDIMEATNHA